MVHQVWLPLRASRLIIATDSVFNAFDTFHKAAGALRDVSLANAAAALLRCSQQRKQHRHDFVDASVLVVDFVPETGMPFKSQVWVGKTCSQHKLCRFFYLSSLCFITNLQMSKYCEYSP